MTRTESTPHSFTFVRSGGFDQVHLKTAEDLKALPQLDQKLWVALACPTTGLEMDPATLKYLDLDGDGRIRAPEVLEAVKWTCGQLKDPGILFSSTDDLPLDAINDATPEGKKLKASARQILVNLGRPEGRSVSVADTSDTARVFAQTWFNGDGIIPVEATDDPAVAAVLQEILKAHGGLLDRSGKQGVDTSRVDAFYAEAQAFSDWWAKAEGDPAVLPFGASTADAWAAGSAVASKVEDFFARCRLAAFDPRAVEALNREEKEYLALAAKDLSITPAEVAGLPLSRIGAGRALPLTVGLNPAWAAAMATFRERVVTPILGPVTELSEDGWATIQATLAPYAGWLGAKAGASAESLGLARVRAILAGPERAAIRELIDRDLALKEEAEALQAVDKLIHFRRDLVVLLNNFVSFRDFYDPSRLATFQAGVLYMDQRSCDLCIEVTDMGRHTSMAPASMAYLAYCDCVRKATGQTRTIVAAFTDGDAEQLRVGRNGIFYDRHGNDWDATITKVVENPMSIRQAFLAPYKRVGRWIEDQIAARAAAADAESTAKLQTAATETGAAAKSGEAPKEKPKLDVGVIAALGVAVGGIAAAVGALLDAIFGLGIFMPLGLLGIVLIISGPSMLVAWLKLRQRNLGPILDANGWAVNSRAVINVSFGQALTHMPVLPAGADRQLDDPFQDKSNGKWWVLLGLLVLAVGVWLAGLLAPWAPSPLVPDAPPPPAEAAPAAPPAP